MRRFQRNQIAIDQGSKVLFSDFSSNGPMWAGNGPREAETKITFSEPFLSQPVVHVSISMWDTGADVNQRADIRAEKVNEKGFSAVFRTWGDSRVGRIRVDWMAIGELSDDDAWDVD